MQQIIIIMVRIKISIISIIIIISSSSSNISRITVIKYYEFNLLLIRTVNNFLH